MHDDQIELDLETVRTLVDDQFPQFRGEELRLLESSGTVNAIVRIGERHAARFPLRLMPIEECQAWLQREAAATAEIATVSPVPVPEVVGVGEPGGDYPMCWSVQTWLDGATAHERDPASSDAFARDIAALIGALRSVDTRGRRFSGQGRGGDLTVHEEWVQTCLRHSGHLVDVDALDALWRELRELPLEAVEVMTHGDLIPGNVLVAEKRLVGLLDCGGFAPADPALDLVSVWHLLDAPRREIVRQALGCSELEWQRGRAWALIQALGLGWYYEQSNPLMARLGVRTLRRVLD